MVITYYGKAFTRAQVGDSIIAFNPLGKDADMKGARFGADVAFVSMKNANFNGVESLSYGEKQPFVISGPGEYEVDGLYVKGIATVGAGGLPAGQAGKVNTVYSVLMENINICHLGGLSSADIKSEIIEQIGEVDILFVPIWDKDVLSPADAEKITNMLEPKIVIPLYYGPGTKEKDVLQLFAKEMGVEAGKPMEKLTIKRKDLEGKEGDVVLLEAQV